MSNKKAYYMGGGGVNEPTPGKKKYKSDTAIVVQPRFVEPFYRNYDLYDVEGVDGPAKHGPGSGWSHMNEHKSVKDFLEFRRKRLQGKYVAEDSWIEDTSANRKERVEKMKIRASLLSKLVKTASGDHHKTLCSNCGAVVAQCRCPGFFHKNESQIINYVNSCSVCKKIASDNNDGPYSNMGKYKSVKDFEESADKGSGALMVDDNADHMLPPKEHGTKIYDWKNSLYQGKSKAPQRYDSNNIDFPIDDQIGSDPIVGNSGSSYVDSIPISYQENYTAEPDQDGKGEATLDFGYDLTNEDAPVGRSDPDKLNKIDLDKLEKKYLTPAETDIYGLPDGVSPEGKDADQTIETENPEFGIPDSGRQMYEDKWNI